MSDLRFDGRVAIVTGAGGGLGREHALLLASRGAKVVVNDIGGSVAGDGMAAGPAETVAPEIGDHGGEAIADTHTVAAADGGEATVRTGFDAFGRVDILVGNAGILRDAVRGPDLRAAGAGPRRARQRPVPRDLADVADHAGPGLRPRREHHLGRRPARQSAHEQPWHRESGGGRPHPRSRPGGRRARHQGQHHRPHRGPRHAHATRRYLRRPPQGTMPPPRPCWTPASAVRPRAGLSRCGLPRPRGLPRHRRDPHRRRPPGHPLLHRIDPGAVAGATTDTPAPTRRGSACPSRIPVASIGPITAEAINKRRPRKLVGRFHGKEVFLWTPQRTRPICPTFRDGGPSAAPSTRPRSTRTGVRRRGCGGSG